MLGIGLNIGNRVMGGFDSSASAYFAATGITGTTERNAINNLIVGLKADGIWSKMKALYPFVTDNRNLLSYTEDFGNAYWGKDTGVTVTTNTTTAPNGTTTADTVSISGVSKALYSPQVSTTSGVVMKISFYIKATSGQEGNTVFVRTPYSEVGQFITLTSQWVRHEINYTTNGATYGVEWSNKNSATATSFYLWGAQLELGSTATTYQPILTTQQSYISNQFKYNLVNPVDSDAAFRLVFNGGWTFSSTGATPNGTNGYADTKLVPSSVLTETSTHLSYYSRTNQINSACDIGARTNTFASPIGILSNFNNTTYGVWGDYTSVALGQNTSAFFNLTKNNNALKLFRNSTQIVTATKTSTLPNRSITMAAWEQFGATEFSSRQTAFASIGDGLNDTEAANLYSRVQTYQTALSRQVP